MSPPRPDISVMSCLPILLLLSFSLIYFLSKLPWAVFLCRTIEWLALNGWVWRERKNPQVPTSLLFSIPLTSFTCPHAILISLLLESYCLDFLQFCLSTLDFFFPHSLLLSKLQTLPFLANLQAGLSSFVFLLNSGFYFKILLFLWSPCPPPPSCMDLFSLHYQLLHQKLGMLFDIILVFYMVLLQYFPPT